LARDTGAFTVDLVQQPPNKPNPPKKPQNPTPEGEEKYRDELEKYKAQDAKWQAEVKKVLEKLSPENLKNYDGVIFANTTGDLPLPDRQAFIDWIKRGMPLSKCTLQVLLHGSKLILKCTGEFQSHGAQASVECINEIRNILLQ
jgi:hypothetical protein